jgi:hypothetical protein
MVCTRCGIEKAWSEAELARIRDNGGPPLPAGICLRCVFKDPQLKAELGGWSDARMKKLIQDARDFAARPLEAIDRFLESFR